VALDDVPLLVRGLAGNPGTAAAILACLNTTDTAALRLLHGAVAGAVADVPWCDLGTKVTDVVRWRAALPCAVGARLTDQAVASLCRSDAVVAALAGVTCLDLHDCDNVTDAVIGRLPTSLRTLNVRECKALTEHASFLRLAALTTLDCRQTSVLHSGVAGLPASLQELVTDSLPAGASLVGLPCLRVLDANSSGLNVATLTSLSPNLLELHATWCKYLAAGSSFARLPALRTLDVLQTTIDDGALATLPPSLVFLSAGWCSNLSCAAVLPHLPALRLLDVSHTGVGDALVASLPAGLMELHMLNCRGVTAAATLDHVPVLQALHSYGTDLAPDVLAACRARGCVVPAAGVLRGHRNDVSSLTLLADGRLVSGDKRGEVRAWDVAAGGGKAAVSLKAGSGVYALAALRDGHRLAVGVEDGIVEIWDVGVVPPMCTTTVARNGTTVEALAVLQNGHLTAGCGDGAVRIIDVDAGAAATTLKEHTDKVTALAVLPDGTLASGSDDNTVRLWDVDARVCIATLAGHRDWVRALVVLVDGRLASGSDDYTVRLWDVGTRTCLSVLTGHECDVKALAALPDGRLISWSKDCTHRVWDTRPATAAAGNHAAGTAPVVAFASGLYSPTALLPLPDGRLACAGDEGAAVYLLHVPPPVAYELGAH